MIAVNLVTGFLGTGKTTLIRHLLAHRPANEQWAVLVNEFGEAGVDGALLDAAGVAIEEVAGGCLCCVAAPAFSVGLNRLIRQYRPDRILIEPSGLGHPAQILDQLRSPLYTQVLSVQATLCVMDARHLTSTRHREHPNFIDQIHLADVLIANKSDCYSDADEHRFMDFAAALPPPRKRLIITAQGAVDPGLLSLEAGDTSAQFPEAHAFLLAQEPSPSGSNDADAGWTRFEGQADDYHRVGWLIGSEYRFNKSTLLAWLDDLGCERIKGLFACEHGSFSYNRAGDTAEVKSSPQGKTSRLQLIDTRPIDADALEKALRELADRSGQHA